MHLLKRLAQMATVTATLSFCAVGSAMAQEYRIEPVVDGLSAPWGIAPLGGDRVLITQKGGELLYFDGQSLQPVAGAPKVVDDGQGGLLDITLARDFEQTREVFITYAKKQGRGSGTTLISARLSQDHLRLENIKQIFEMKPGSRGGRHFGSRVVEAQDGTLFVTIGDRGDRPAAQDLNAHNGSVIRINRDGSVPADNPFVGQSGALPQIWSYGHRNPQGAGLDLQGNLWVSEHGARGGDEVNAVRKGANYGWPVISYGRHYSGGKIGEGTAKAGMEQPAHYWDPSMAPSGLLVYSGALFPAWRGHTFVGSLKFDYIAQLAGNPMSEIAQIKSRETMRVRDIVEGPAGAIWFISVGEGSVFRIVPN